jgi:hypothetical protein
LELGGEIQHDGCLLSQRIRPGDRVYFSLRNYPGHIRSAKEYVDRGVIQGQGVPSGNLPDTDPRRIRQTDTLQAGQDFQVVIHLQDGQPDQPLRVGYIGATGRVTVFAGGGFPVVNELATILHTVFSWLDYLHPKPSLLMVVFAVVLIVGIVVFLRRRFSSMGASAQRCSQTRDVVYGSLSLPTSRNLIVFRDVSKRTH